MCIIIIIDINESTFNKIFNSFKRFHNLSDKVTHINNGHLRIHMIPSALHSEVCSICCVWKENNNRMYKCITCSRHDHILCIKKEIPRDEDYICIFCSRRKL